MHSLWSDLLLNLRAPLLLFREWNHSTGERISYTLYILLLGFSFPSMTQWSSYSFSFVSFFLSQLGVCEDVCLLLFCTGRRIHAKNRIERVDYWPKGILSLPKLWCGGNEVILRPLWMFKGFEVSLRPCLKNFNSWQTTQTSAQHIFLSFFGQTHLHLRLNSFWE